MTGTLTNQPPPRATLDLLCAEGRFADALAVYRAGDDPWFASAEAGLLAATAAARIGAFGEAWSLVTPALIRFAKAGDRRQQMRALNLMGGICFERGELARAETAFGTAARMAADLGDEPAAARAWNNLGMVTHLRHQPLAALDMFHRALTLHERHGHAPGIAQARHNLGLVFRDAREYTRATREVAQAVFWADRANDPPLRGVVVLGRAELAIATGDLASATRDLAVSRGLAAAANDGYGVGEAMRVDALLALAEHRYPAADVAASDAVRHATSLGAIILTAESLAVHGLALRALGRRDEAETAYAEATKRLRAVEALGLHQRILHEWERCPNR